MDVRMITFTGSGRAGGLIQQAAATSNLKNVLLELGGKSPAVIFGDADLERAAKKTANSIQWNSGQVCMATSRIYVHSSIADHFIPLFKEKLQAITPGDPTDPSVDHGPQADETQFKAVKRLIELGKKDGKLLVGGDAIADHEGYYIQPTIFVETPESAQIMQEEIFGPVVNVNVFDSEEEVIEKVNDTEYGLYASVYTRDIERALRFVKSMEAGSVVGINCTSPTGAFDMPFGGWKGSGIGREGIHHSMNHYLETKTVLMRIGDS
jgi:aldehyde dehydrogenase (NAD+)